MTKLMSVTDIAELAGVSPETVYKWNSQGTGPRRITIGKYVRYRPEDVEAWLDANGAI